MSARRRRRLPAIGAEARRARQRARSESAAQAAEARGDRTGAALIRSRQEAIDADRTARGGGAR
jgi:hypothetical protein